MKELLSKIESEDALVGVIGLGYVGLPLAVMFAEAGLAVLGFEKDPKKGELIGEGKSYIGDIPDSRLAGVGVSGNQPSKGKLGVALDFSELSRCDAIVICVPTPLAKTKDPDLSYVISSSEEIAKNLRSGQLVVLESTTYPGTTRELILPCLEGSGGLKVGEDFFLSYSPERVDPGNPVYDIKNTPKVVGGVTEACVEIASALYGKIVNQVVPVSSTDAAELSKLLENTFRLINIGLVNEFSVMCRQLGVDVWEVIDAAATKPFGFIPFYPGPGLGGHCIPVDPHYLSWKLRLHNFKAQFIELASEINSQMPRVVIDRLVTALNDHEKSVKGSKVTVLGVAYKKDIDDVRESPALDVMGLLLEKGANLSYVDPHVSEVRIGERVLKSEPLNTETLSSSDAVVIVTDHSDFDAKLIAENSPLIVDTRNFLAKKGLESESGDRLYKL